MKKILFYIFLVLPFIAKSQDSLILENNKLLINRMSLEEYHKICPDSLMLVLLPAVWKERDSLVFRYSHHVTYQQDIMYYYANRMMRLSESMVQSFDKEQLWKKLADTVMENTPLPSEDGLLENEQSTLFLEYYVSYQLRVLFLLAKEQGGQVVGAKVGHPVDSLRQLVGQHGELALGLLYARKILPEVLASHYLSNQLIRQMDEKNLALSEMILKELKTYFPYDPIITWADMEISQLYQLLTVNTNSANILFIQHPDTIQSVEQLLAPFAGKVVYLDF